MSSSPGASRDPDSSATSASLRPDVSRDGASVGASTGQAPAGDSSGLVGVGNSTVLDALGSAGPGFGSVVREVALMRAAGMNHAMSSNTVARKVHRHSQAQAEGIDMERAAGLIRSSTGERMPTAVRTRFEQAFDHDFGAVRVHRGGTAAQAAAELNAHAFAMGAEIFFGSGAYAPGSASGDRLLAHELTHVVQHDEGRLPTGGGDVSHPHDAHEREAYANEGRIVRLLAEVDAALADGTPDPADLERAASEPAAEQAPATLEPEGGPATLDEQASALGADVFGAAPAAGPIIDTDEDRARHTQALLGPLGQALGVDTASLEVRADEEAGQQVRELGTIGLYQDGRILLDPTAYDPGTAFGKELLGHEMAHAAQDLLPADTVMDGVMAEGEAELVGSAFAAGQDVGPVSMGLPESHSAQFGDSGAKDLVAALTADMDAETEAIQAQVDKVKEDTPDAPEDSPEQDREAKLEQYEDGVDGIADQIGDLSAFDDLEDAIDDEDSGARRDALSRIERTESFGKLADMWAGALAGEEDASRMKASFTDEFDGRGWGSDTEEAFDAVEGRAKSKGEQLYAEKQEEQAKAKEAREKGKEKASEEEKGEGEGEGEGGEPGAEQGDGLEGVSDDVKALMDADVPDTPPEMATFNQAQERMTGGTFESVTTELADYNAFSSGITEAAEGGAVDRMGVVGDALFEGLVGGFTKGFVSQGADSLLFDTLGSLGDFALKSKFPAFKAPLIGPMISLAQVAYDPKGFVKGLGDGLVGGAKDFGQAGENFTKMWDKGFSQDGFAYMCLGIADVLAGLAKFVGVLSSVLGVLSALCFVVGGILIAVGLALSWLGVGVTLLPIGGWLINAGNVLGRVVNVLGPITLALTVSATLFRTLGALLVPAEDFANAVAGVESDAQAFGEKAGAKMADSAASNARQAAGNKFGKKKTNKPKGDGANSEGDGSGGGRSKKASGEADDGSAQLKKAKDDLDKAKTESESGGEGGAGKGKTKPGDTADADAGTGSKPKSRLKKVGSMAKKVSDAVGLSDTLKATFDLKNTAKQLGDVRKDLGDLNPFNAERRKAAANRGIATAVDADALPDQKKKIADAKQKIGELDGKISDMQSKVGKEASKLRQLEAELAKMRAEDSAAFRERGETMSPERQKAHAEKTAAASKARKQLEETRTTLADAKKSVQRANKELTRSENRQATKDRAHEAHDQSDVKAAGAMSDEELADKRDKISQGDKAQAKKDKLGDQRDDVSSLESRKGNLETRIRQHEKQAAKLEERAQGYEDQGRQSRADRTRRDAKGRRETASELKSELSDVDTSLPGAKKKLEKLESKYTEADDARIADGQSVKDDGHSDRSLQDAQNVQSMKETHGAAHDDKDSNMFGKVVKAPGSGNATGGVGSAYKDLLESELFGDLYNMFAGVEKSVEEASNGESSDDPQTEEEKKQAEAEKKAKEVQASEANLVGPEKDKTLLDKYKGMGDSAANFVVGQFGDNSPYAFLKEEGSTPPGEDLEQMNKAYERADDAADDAVRFWAEAAKAELAEDVAKKSIAEKEKLDKEHGETVEKSVEKLKPKGEEFKAREEERAAKIAGAKEEPKKPDDEAKGTVGQLGSKMGGSAKKYAKGSDGGNASKAGGKATEGVDSATDSSKEANEKSEEMSKRNKEAIEASSTANDQAGEKVAADREGLQASIDVDKGELEQIQVLKAQNLKLSQENAKEAEDEAGKFNTGMDDWVIWASKYKSAKGG